jgi:hypothetical protein
MSVNLGGLDAGMAEQLLQHVRGHSIRMGQPCRHRRLLDLEQRRLAREHLGAMAHRVEQLGGGGSPGIGRGQLLPEGNGLDRPLVQRHEALLVALAAHQEHAGP